MSSAYDVIRQFEDRLSDFCGSKYAVCVDSCSNALLLSCVYSNVHRYDEIIIPSRTYPSVPCAIIHARGRVKFEDKHWVGQYRLEPTLIYDAAKDFSRGCYTPGSYTCLSFHGKKLLNIGRGGAILTDSEEARDWFKMARFDGRHECALPDDTLGMVGYNCYMTPEQAARGLVLMDFIGDGKTLPYEEYIDLSTYSMYTEANR